jgi:guanylate kinase
MQNKLVIFSAPSGAGKTTIVRFLLGQNPELKFSVSACSRAKRPHEVDGKDYYFLSVTEFKEKIMNDEFIEWEEVYQDHFYGTLKSELERIWAKGKSAVFDVDVVGGLNIKKQYGSRALAIFVMPPSIQELEARLSKRSTENPQSLRTRLEKADKEMKYASGFDVVLLNDNLEQAKKEASDIVKEFLRNP